MNLISVNDNCVSCGLCSKVCPLNIIEMTAEKVPAVAEAKASICLDCGQCVAVCPKAALSHERVAFKTAPSKPENAEQVEAVIKNRRSIRAYTNESVSTEMLNEIFEIARYAPTGGNAQPVKWTVVNNPEMISNLVESIVDWMKEMIETNPNSELMKYIPMQYFVSEYEKGNQRITYGAPCLVIPHGDQNHWHADLDCTIAISYLEFVANAYGLGSCWAGVVDFALKNNASLRKMLGIPESHMNHNVLLLGKAKYTYPQFPERKSAQINWI